ncbi:MAG TPA: glycoside hydrolase family 3 N-terminal domain-containing protein [Prolixibacteraceae bacterium]|nr:glycoside hydrolase family 3 N-terminal domain-containing protein [Prolixibacteraceae bacterium]
MKRIFALLTFTLFLQIALTAQVKNPVYKDKNAPVEARVKDLVSKMNLEEKILQLNQYTAGQNTNINNIGEAMKTIPSEIGSLIYFGADPAYRNAIQKKAMEESRLGIPILFGYDVIHGFRTVYPISLAQACSWNPALVTEAAAVAAKEAKLSGVDWTFSPMIDVARDARWGRVSEGYGEDPYTNAVFGVATVKGYQGKNLSDQYSIAACLKHYVGYGESEGGRDYHYSDISMQSLWETYLPPYEAGVKAGAATLMSSFNDISGVPGSANPYTLTEILKNRWKHDGFVVSDWDAINQLIAQGVAADRKEAGYKAFMAGIEMDMTDNIYAQNLKQLIEEKKIPMEKIDEAVSRILRVKFRLGLFDQPYSTVVEEPARYLQADSKAVAQKMAAESMVLLKNNNKTLPLTSSVKQIALIGPMAENKVNLLGSWAAHGNEKDVESILEGLAKEFANGAKINVAKGCDFEGNDEAGFAEALSVAQKSDVVLVCLGEKREWSGENASRSTIALPAIQEKLVQELKKAGKPIVLILSSGRPLELIRLEPLADAMVEIWQPGVAGGSALAGILSGRINPSAKLAITFPLTTGQIPVYYNMRQSARPYSGKYQDIPTEPLYWLGHGLSYTTYNYGDLKLSSTKIKKTEKLTVEVEVINTGNVSGTETVLWFINDPACSISRPMKELKFFEKKEIAAGAKSVYAFEIDPMRDLSYVDSDGKRFLETGEYFVMVNKQKVKFEVTE